MILKEVTLTDGLWGVDNLQSASRCVGALFMRGAGRVSLPIAARKILVQLGSATGEPQLLGGNLLDVKWKADPAGWRGKKPEVQKGWMLEHLAGALNYVSDWLHVESGWVERGVAYVTRCHYENRYRHGARAKRGDGVLAELLCHHDVSLFEAVIRLSRGDSVLQYPAFSAIPDEIVFRNRLGPLRWVDGNVLELRARLPEHCLRIKVSCDAQGLRVERENK